MFKLRSFAVLFVSAIQLPAITTSRAVQALTGFEAMGSGKLVAHDGAYSLAVEAGRTTLTISNRRTRRSNSVITTIAGANPRSRVEGADPLPGQANYLLGDDRSRWHAGIPRFARALERNVYPGVDLAFHGAGGKLEYDFIVQPGADPRRIRLAISGAARVRVTAEGAMLLTTPAGEARWEKPEVYQQDGARRLPVKGAFAVHGRHVTFTLGPYDRKRALIIDPTLAYGTYFGGSDDEGSRAIAVDSSGNIYLTGFTFSTNLAHTAGSAQPAYHGGSLSSYLGGDVFVAKFAPSGTLVYVTYLGGSADDVGTAIAVDPAGNAYVTGYTTSGNFPTTTGAYQTKFGGGQGNQYNGGVGGDAFVSKLNPAGTALVYSTYLGGSRDEKGAALAVDSSGYVYVGGATLSTDFPTKIAYQSTFGGSGGNPNLCNTCGPLINEGDGFVAKLTPLGTDLVFSTYLGGQFDDAVTSLAADSSGVYAGGTTLSPNFPVSNGYQMKYGGAAPDLNQPVIKVGDGFVTKFDPLGNLLYSTYLGGSSDDAVMGVAVDSTGAVYVTGFTSSSNFPVTAKAAQATFRGPNFLLPQKGFWWGDAFAAKLSPSGGALVYSTYLGGSDDDAGMAIAVDAAGEAFVGGFANSTNFPVSTDALQQGMAGSGQGSFTDPTGDGFLTKLSADGSSFLYSSYFGGSRDDAITGVALDTQGSAYVAGSTTSSNLPVTQGAAQQIFGGLGQASETMGDAFLAVFSGIFTPGGGGNGPVISAVLNGASFVPGLVSNAWLTIKGSNFAAAYADWTNSVIGGKLPTMVGGVSVAAGGQPAYVQAISPTQINAVAPNLPAGPVQVTVTTGSGTSAPFSTTAQIFGPGFFLWPGGYAVATRTDFTPAVKPGTFSGLTTTAPKPGETIILWGSGFGPTNPAMPVGVALPSDTTYYSANNVTVTVGGVSAQVIGAALGPGFASAYLVAIQVPASLADGDYPVVATVSGAQSPSTTLLTVQH